jgi:superfamily II DNA or RNA helicase
MTKEQITANANDLFKKYPHILLNYAVGTGKTRTALTMAESSKAKNVVILVSEITHINEWQREIEKWDININATILCQASMKKITDNKYDLVIIDECHHLSRLRLSHLLTIVENNPNVSFIGLSATVDDDTINYIKCLFPDLYVSRFNLLNSIREGIVKEPEIICIGIDMPEKMIITMQKLDEEISGLFSATKNADTEKKRQYLTFRMKKLGLERKQIFGEAKTEIAKKFINDNLKDARSIIFCSDIKQCDELGGEYSMHSKITKANKKLIAFNNKETNNLYVVGMAIEGVNLVDTDNGVIIQLPAKPEKQIQILGRLLRSEDPKIYILYFKNSADERYLNSLRYNLQSKYFNYIDLNQ